MLRAALALFAALGVGLCALGLLYLTLDQFMPYHGQALQIEWADLPENYRGFIIGALRALGAGAAVSGVAIVWMAVASWRDTVAPYRWLLPMTSIGYTSLLCWATRTVSTQTPGEPPLLLNILAVAAAIAASLGLALATRKSA